MWIILQNVSFMMDKQRKAPIFLFDNLQTLLPCPACRLVMLAFTPINQTNRSNSKILL
jgi:cytidine deaminase